MSMKVPNVAINDSRTMRMSIAILGCMTIVYSPPLALSQANQNRSKRVGAAVSSSSRDRTPRLRILVPAYFYPAGEGLKYWDRLIKAASQVSIVAIANPASGPGKKPDPNYLSVLKRARDAGVTVIGYVSTSYSRRSSVDVTRDVDRWMRFYPNIQGFFFDEQASDARHVDYYVKLRKHVNAKIRNAIVITNPGMLCDKEYFTRRASDATCVFENVKGYDAFRLPDWSSSTTADRYAALVHGVRTSKQMRDHVRDSIAKRMGYIYVTDDTGENPWDSLPSFWPAEVAAIKALALAEPAQSK